MGRIDDALVSLQQMEDETERALQLAGLISTLFKIRGVGLVVTGQLAFDSYANTTSPNPELELASFAGKFTPRLMQDIMVGQLHAEGLIGRWKVAGLPVRFIGDVVTAHRALCRDFTTDHGVVKLIPAEEITVERILAAVYPVPNAVAQEEARLLLINGLTNAFQMDWAVLRTLADSPDYRVGEELAQMRAAAKQEVDALGLSTDHVGQPEVSPPAESHGEVAASVPETVQEVAASAPSAPKMAAEVPTPQVAEPS